MQDSGKRVYDEVEHIDIKQQHLPSEVHRSVDSIQSIFRETQSELEERKQKVQKFRSRFSSAIRKLSHKSIRKKEKAATTIAAGEELIIPAIETAAVCIESNEAIIRSAATKEATPSSAISISEALSHEISILKPEKVSSKKVKALSKNLFGLKNVKILNENLKSSKAKIGEAQDQKSLKDCDKLVANIKKSTDNENVETIKQAEYKNKFQFTISAKKVEGNSKDNNSTKTFKKQNDIDEDYLIPLVLNKNRKTNVATNVTFVTSVAQNVNNNNNINNGIQRKKVIAEKSNNQQNSKESDRTNNNNKSNNNRNNTVQSIKDIPSNEKGPLKPSRLYTATNNNINNNNTNLLQTNEVSSIQNHSKGAIRKSFITSKVVKQKTKTATDNKCNIGRELKKSSHSSSPKLKSKVISLTATLTPPTTASISILNEGKNLGKFIGKDAAKCSQQPTLSRPTLIVSTSCNNNNNNSNKKNKNNIDNSNSNSNNNDLSNVTKSEEEQDLKLPKVGAVKQRSIQAIQTVQSQQQATPLKATLKATIQNTKSTNAANSTQLLLEPPDYPPPFPPQAPKTPIATTTTTTAATTTSSAKLTPVMVPFQSPRTSVVLTTDIINNCRPIDPIRTTATTVTSTITTPLTTVTNNHHTSLNTIIDNSYYSTTTTATTIDGISKYNLTQEFPSSGIDINSVTSVQSEAIDDNISLAESVQSNIPIQESLSSIVHLILDNPVQVEQSKHQQWFDSKTSSEHFKSNFNNFNQRNNYKESFNDTLQDNLDIKRRVRYVSQPTLRDDFDSLEQLSYSSYNNYSNNNNCHRQSGVSDLSLDFITDNNITLEAKNVQDVSDLRKLKETQTKCPREIKGKEVNVMNDWPMPAYGDLTMDQDMEPTIMTTLNNEKREHLYKILVIGELGTGKTSFIKRYVHQFFSQNYRATIGVDFALKVLHWDSNTVVRLQLWDIAGQERFGNMTRVYYKEAVGAFIVFDVTRSGTFECVSKWKEDLDSKVQLPDGTPIPCILLANKCDQEKQGTVANADKMDEYVRENGFAGWFETSAKENINIDEAARALVNKILLNDKLISSSDLNDGEKFNLNNTDNQNVQDNKGKCSC